METHRKQLELIERLIGSILACKAHQDPSIQAMRVELSLYEMTLPPENFIQKLVEDSHRYVPPCSVGSHVWIWHAQKDKPAFVTVEKVFTVKGKKEIIHSDYLCTPAEECFARKADLLQS